ncbi:MAG: hypothetical protein ACK5IP_05185, partial [Paracoccus sp. (in: a-proteobacteria)]
MTDRPALADYLSLRPETLKRGPLAMILCEDLAAIPATLDHALARGFRHILALSPEPLDLPPHLRDEARITNLIHDTRRP